MPTSTRKPGRTQQRLEGRQPTKDVETLAWAGAYLGISRNTAFTWAQTGKIPGCHKWGGRWLVSVPRFLEAVHGEATAKGVA